MADRRRFPRVAADILCRPAGMALFHHRRNTHDVSLGGIRVFTDEPVTPGSRLDLDVMLPDGGVVRCWAKVVWRLDLDGDRPAHFDVGLEFVDMAPADVQRLASVLVRAG